MYLKHQILKILKICFQNMSYFSWIKLIPVLIYLKYWYYNSQRQKLSCLHHHFCMILPLPTEIPIQHNPHHVLYRFPYFVLTHETTCRHNYWIYQTISQAKPIKFVVKLYLDHHNLGVKHPTDQNAESFRDGFLSKLANTVNNKSIFSTKYANILNKMVGAPSFSQPYLCIHQLLQSPPKISSSTSVNFHFTLPPLLVHKIIFTIPTNTPFLYTIRIFHFLISAYYHPNNLHENFFLYLSRLANSGCIKGPGS